LFAENGASPSNGVTSVPDQLADDAPSRRGKASRRRRSKRRAVEFEDDPVSYTVEPMDSERLEPESAPETLPAEGVQPTRFSVAIDESRIDQDAAKVVRRLVRHGYEAYLVGGCVRDLLLDAQPKDFDVATSARPEVVRRLFRNSRIIGRRFRLVHVLYGGGKVIETATFRRNPTDDGPPSDDLLIRDDNTFGAAHEDAARRDFTINALFYDLDRGEVLDWCDGMHDVERRAVRTIGDPSVRFKEDPVRMLRAIKFCARLDLGMDPETYDAIVHCRGALAMAARPRLFEELLRLLRGGAAHRSVWLAWETGVLDILVPELAAFLYDKSPGEHRVWQLLDCMDELTKEEQVDDIVLLSLFLLEPLLEACEGRRDRVQACQEFVEPLVERLAVPRRIADAVRRIAAILPKLANGGSGKFSRTALYPFAAQLLDCMRRVTPEDELRAGSMRPPPRRRKRSGKRRPPQRD
jgi:poly(A) polymerase